MSVHALNLNGRFWRNIGKIRVKLKAEYQLAEIYKERECSVFRNMRRRRLEDVLGSDSHTRPHPGKL